MSKLGIVAAAGAGSVLGARAGHERYEQIRDQARRLWSDPRVQRGRAQAEDVVREKAPRVADAVIDDEGPDAAPTPNDMPGRMPEHPADPVTHD